MVESGPKGTQLQLAFLQTRLAFQQKQWLNNFIISSISRIDFQHGVMKNMSHAAFSTAMGSGGSGWVLLFFLGGFGVGEKHRCDRDDSLILD